MVYFLAGLNLEDGGARFWLFWIGIILLFFLGLTLAEACAFGTPNEQIGIGVFTLSLTIQSLFAGFLVRESNIPDYWVWLYYINAIRYPLYYFSVNELDGLDISCPGNEVWSNCLLIRTLLFHLQFSTLIQPSYTTVNLVVL